MNKGASRRFCKVENKQKEKEESLLEKAKKLYDLEYSISDIAKMLNVSLRDARWLYSLIGYRTVRF